MTESAEMKLRIPAILLLLLAAPSSPQGNSPQRVMQSLYGQWTITKVVEVGGHAQQTKEVALAQIGKTLRIGSESFDHDSKFLYFEDVCTIPDYKLQATNSEKGSLGFYGLEQEDTAQFLVVRCGGRDSYFLELAKNQELAVYYDGWFFFLRKIKATEVYRDVDAYEIYATLLRSENHPQYVIQMETSTYPGLTAKQMGIEGDKAFMRVWRIVMDDFAKQNQDAKLLAKNIPVDVPYELTTTADAFGPEHGQVSWDSFYQRFPSSGGMYSFSSVGFNPQRTRAIVQMNNSCGMLCGHGAPHFFEKRGAKWHEVSVKAIIQEWYS